MADDERRAEIEAVAKALEGPLPDHAASFYAPRVIEALDRVRDARGDDEDPETRREIEELKAELRSPQGEDHEAGIEAAARMHFERWRISALRWDELTDVQRGEWRDRARQEIAAYLSRVSPSRDGTVAVEDVARWLYEHDAEFLIRSGWDSDTEGLKAYYYEQAAIVARLASPASTAGEGEVDG